MEIPAWVFFSFWAVISTTFLHLGFYTIDKTEFSTTVSPVVMSFFKHSLAISSCCSSGYALILRSRWGYDVRGCFFWMAFEVIPVLVYSTFWKRETYSVLWAFLSYAVIEYVWLDHLPRKMIFAKIRVRFRTIILLPTALFPSYFLVVASINFILLGDGYGLTPARKTSIGIHMALEASLFFVSRENTKFSPVLVLLVSFLISAFWAGLSWLEPCARVPTDPLSGDESFKPVAAKVEEFFSTLKEKNMGKLIGYAVGMAGTVLFQYFFRLTSFNHVVAFLYLAVMWVANLALLGVSNDFGAFNFLLGNVVVGCTVSQFGFGVLPGLRMVLLFFCLVCGSSWNLWHWYMVKMSKCTSHYGKT